MDYLSLFCENWGVKKFKEILKKEQEELFDRHKYVSHEFQDFGYRLALKLNDVKHKSLYMRLAKNEDRGVLERALSFAIDYPKARNKAKIFMWKLKELKGERAPKDDSKMDADTNAKRDPKAD